MAAWAQTGMAIAIVDLPFLRIAEHRIGLGRFLELVRGLLVAAVAIGMELHRQNAISLFQLIVGGVLLDAEHFVKIKLRSHC